MEELKVIVKVIDEKKGENINIIDVSSVNPLTVYYVIATVFSTVQAQAISKEISQKLIENKLAFNHIEGKAGISRWILVDAQDIIVHLFVNEEREIFKLDELYQKLPHIAVSDILN
ncbi:MAG: ribosome silencing factor [Bacillales bacterium]|jgi:ribosome-associated protein|nr:ribosome silencing factor [Bacillales bacterium]